ncbi:hypothetical protein HDV03_001347 [Kappamyces sp. JEL0829]|nr:hypothetical protein HDV03_001347 [Kappamyces sp. JEL0829]
MLHFARCFPFKPSPGFRAEPGPRVAETVLATLVVQMFSLSLLLSIAAVAATPSVCPSYDSIHDPISLQGYKASVYQGEWYPVAHNEPTEPAFCTCDRITWLLDANKPKQFVEDLDARCKTGIVDFPLHLGLSGEHTPNATEPGIRTEGSPPLAAWIPNMLLYIERDAALQAKTGYEYTSVIVYSCKKGYLTKPFSVFDSLQIFSRDPTISQAHIQVLVAKAQALGVDFDPSSLRFPQSSGACTYPASRLPATFVKA